MAYVPIVIEQDGRGERAFDIYSRLLRDRIVFLGSSIDDQVANTIVAQLLHLESSAPGKEISLYINSPGGSVSAGMAIFDTMRYINAPVATVCVGQAASMAALLLAAGEKGRRFALPNSRIMIHQPLGAFQGQASDIDIQAKEILRLKDELNRVMADLTGQSLAKIAEDTERDYYMRATQAEEYGIIDGVIVQRIQNAEKSKEGI